MFFFLYDKHDITLSDIIGEKAIGGDRTFYEKIIKLLLYETAFSVNDF